MSPQVEREAIARIISPSAMKTREVMRQEWTDWMATVHFGNRPRQPDKPKLLEQMIEKEWGDLAPSRYRALATADAILALRQPGAEYRRGEPSGETLEQYGERIAAKVRRVMMDQLDDDVIGCLGQSHIVFGKACAMEAVTTAMNEVRALSDSIPDTKGGRDG